MHYGTTNNYIYRGNKRQDEKNETKPDFKLSKRRVERLELQK